MERPGETFVYLFKLKFSVKKINIRQAVCHKHKIIQDETHILRSATFQYSGRVPLYVYSSLYMTIKLTFSNDIGGLSTARHHFWIAVEHPGHSIGVLNSKHFKSILWQMALILACKDVKFALWFLALPCGYCCDEGNLHWLWRWLACNGKRRL